MLFTFMKKKTHKKMKLRSKKIMLFWTESSLMDYIILLLFESLYLIFFMKSMVSFYLFSITDNNWLMLFNMMQSNKMISQLFHLNKNFLMFIYLFIYFLFILFIFFLMLILL